MSDERFYIETDAHGEPTIWRIDGGYGGEDAAVLSRHEVRDIDLWHLICVAVTS